MLIINIEFERELNKETLINIDKALEIQNSLDTKSDQHSDYSIDSNNQRILILKLTYDVDFIQNTLSLIV